MSHTVLKIPKGVNVQGGESGRPSEAVRELIRRGAEMSLDNSAPWWQGMQEVPLGSRYARQIADDPVVAGAIRRSTRASCLRWVAENISRPGEPVSTGITEEELAAVRNVVSRGLDEAAVVDAYRLAQNAAFQYWVPLALQLTSDSNDLRELLDVCQRSIASFIEALVAQLCDAIRAERKHLSSDTDPAIHEIVTVIINGGTLSAESEERLRYVLGQHHTAVVLWSDCVEADATELDRVARALTNCVRGRQSLVMRPDAATRWMWLAGSDIPNMTDVATSLEQTPGIRIAVGPTSFGIEGFRQGHLDALTAQRLVAQTRSPRRLVKFAEIELVALLTSDPGQADRFVERTLGKFASADGELRRTVLTFIHERNNSSRTAARLFIHRNTLHARLMQADDLLPQPLCEDQLGVAVALEMLAWKRREADLDPQVR